MSNLITAETLEALRLHKLWLAGYGEGKRANLTGANLTGAYLSRADLRNAYLSDATGAELAIQARSHKVDMPWLIEHRACAEGRAWVAAELGGTVSYLDCLAAGRDDYAEWLYPQVLTYLIKMAKEDHNG